MTGYGKSTSGLLAWCGGSRGLAWLAGLNLAIGIPLCLLALAGSRLHAAEATVYSWLALPPLFSEWLMRPWTLLTYMAAHFSLLQLLFNTAWLIWFGRMLLDVAPQRMLLQLYIGGGIAGGLCYMAAGTLLGGAGAGLSGASVAVLSLMTATALTMPNRQIPLLLIGTVRLKWIAVVTIVLSLLFGGGGIPTQAAHAGGILFGGAWHYCGGAVTAWWQRLWRPRPRKVKRDASEMSEILMDRSGYTRRRAERHDERVYAGQGAPADHARLDELLDKIRVSGYSSLSRREKSELNSISQRIEE